MKFALLVVLIFASVHAAAAGMRSVSHSEWRIAETQVTVRIDFPVTQAAALTGKRFALLTTGNVGAYVLGRIGVSAGGKPCPATDQGYDLGNVNALSLGGDLYGFEIVFRCADAGPLRLRNTVFMDEVPSHADYAQVEAAGRQVQQVFTARHASVDIAPEDPKSASAARFIPLGASHMAGSLSRVGALLALLLLAAKRRILVLGALSAGYVLSWVLALSGLQPEIAGLEAVIGFISVAGAAILIAPAAPRRFYGLVLGSIALLGIGMAVIRHPPAGVLLIGLTVLAGALLLPERLDRKMPLVVLCALFGIVDGFVLPGDFARLALERVDALPLAAFDLGSLLCAALLLGVGWAVVRLVERSRLSWPRLATRDLATSLLSGFGLFWMLSPF